MPMPEPCRLIGVLDNGAQGLGVQALQHIQEADVVIGAARTLALLAPHVRAPAERHDLTGRLAQLPGLIGQALAANRRTVVLATGDPLCHGVGGYLLDKLGHAAIEILPNVSTIQLACARLGLPWQDIHICSIHSQDTGEWTPGAGPGHGLYALAQDVQRHGVLAVFTSPGNTPARIARLLQAEGLDHAWRMTIAERLLRADERMRRDLAPAEAAQLDFADPNVVLLERRTPAEKPVLFGLPDERFHQRKPGKGLITKREVRAVSLARMQLRVNSIVWDIGAGSGAVGLEAARLCPQGHVYAIEKNADDAAIAASNRAQLHIGNYSLVQAKAPQGIAAWPDPDAVFIGGSGGELEELIRHCLRRLRPDGCLVMNFVTLENQAEALRSLESCGAAWDVTQLQAARSQPILHMHRMAAENPVWIIVAKRG
jgi:precorrin-6Y C5,15-methyltransferase (decarboxylating)